MEGPVVGKNGRLVWREYRETARTLLPVAYVERGNPDLPVSDPPASIIKAVVAIYKRKKSCAYHRLVEALAREAAQTGFTPEDLVENLVSARWLDKRVKLGRDGISELETKLVAGYKLEQALGEQAGRQKNRARQWVNQQRKILAELQEHPVPEGSRGAALIKIKDLCRDYLDTVDKYLGGTSPVPEITQASGNWRFKIDRLPNSYTLAVDFLLAMGLAIITNPAGFDWKEVGAIIRPRIGASKRFDRLRHELPEFFEVTTGIPAEDAGLISRGSLYSIYLAGDYTVSFPGGSVTGIPGAPVTALTNVQLEETGFIHSRARRVVLTENRALLLKMYKTGWLARNPDLLAIGLDGRLRNAHRHLLEALAAQGERLFFTWVDTDPAGRSIASAVADLLPGALFVLPPQTVCTYHQWVEYLQKNSNLLNSEQEGNLGEPATWDILFCNPDKPEGK